MSMNSTLRRRVGSLAAMGIVAGTALAGALVPSAAFASTEPHVVTVPMTVDCSTMTPKATEYAVAHHISICGVGETSTATTGSRLAHPNGQGTGNCGTASIYVDGIGKGHARVSWGLHSTKGIMVARDLGITWGPAHSGTFADISPMFGEDYSNHKDFTGVKGYMGASMHGTVGILSGEVACAIPGVYALQIKF